MIPRKEVSSEDGREHYRAVQTAMDDYMFACRLRGLRAGASARELRLLINFRRVVHRLYRTKEPGRLLDMVSLAAVRWVGPELSSERVASVAVACLEALGRSMKPAEADWMRNAVMVRAAVPQVASSLAGESETEGTDVECWTGKEGNMESEVKVQIAECKMQNEERPEETVVVLKASELAAKVEEFLATRQVVAASDAGQIARDMAESLARGLKPEKPRKRGRRPKAADGQMSAVTVTGPLTVREKFRREQAMGALRTALSGHQPVVKFVVAGRLCARRTFEDLAQEYGLTKDEVLDILSKMHGWVSRFTTFFEADWFWKDGLGKYFIPDLPQLDAGK